MKQREIHVGDILVSPNERWDDRVVIITQVKTQAGADHSYEKGETRNNVYCHGIFLGTGRETIEWNIYFEEWTRISSLVSETE